MTSLPCFRILKPVAFSLEAVADEQQVAAKDSLASVLEPLCDGS
jgi:hypothetical protein